MRNHPRLAWILQGLATASAFFALAFALVALERTNTRDAVTRGIICANTVSQDTQELLSLKTPGLLQKFHLNAEEGLLLVDKQLILRAQERKELQPSIPSSACSTEVTVLKIR